MYKNLCLMLVLAVFSHVYETINLETENRTDRTDLERNDALVERIFVLENTSFPSQHTFETENLSTDSNNNSFNLSAIPSGNNSIEVQHVYYEYKESDSYYQPDLSQTNRYLAQDANSFVCGSKGLCNGSTNGRSPLCSFECQPCQCDQSCHFYGDCCPDLLLEDSPDITSVSNPYLICTVDEWTTWNESVNIFIIGKCPLDSDVGTAAKCEFSDKTIQSEATPVSIVESSVTYRNKFCAKCHGVADYEIWRHEVTCSLWSLVQTATSKADLWRIVVQDGDCEIVTKPSDLVSIRDCYPVEYKTCNASGKVTKAPEPIVERLCQMYSQPVHYYGTGSAYASYRNIFCSICDDIVINPFLGCVRALSPEIPFPLNVLLDFNPVPEITVEDIGCEIGQVIDPFTSTCQNISCPLRRSLVGNECEEIFSMASGLGIAMDFVLQPANKSLTMTGEGFTDQYRTMLNKELERFSPIVIHFGLIEYYASDIEHLFHGLADLIKVHLRIISQTTRSLQELETVLFDVMRSNFSYEKKYQNITLLSDPILCPSKYQVPSQFYTIRNLREIFLMSLTVLDEHCVTHKCEDHIIFEPVQINCSFVEYILNDSLSFSFFPNNHSISFKSFVFVLSPFIYLLCGDTLRICTDKLLVIRQIMTSEESTQQQDLTLSLVSLVCMSLSLVGLALTFITYSLIPTLRTLPGKNTMALVLNLFVAQLLFLTGSNRTSNIVICQILGVLIHYFWLSSVAWMFISAYHMFLVFTTLVTKPVNSGHVGRFFRYVLVCTVSPTVVVAVCLTVFLVTSDGMNSGYGGRVCFISNPMAILGFFAGPLGLMLLLNIFFFVRTVQTIRSVPDMTTSSNQNNRHQVFVYLKLSLLFGFTWIFGLLAEIVQSNVLNYVFVVLTASQGLMLFVGYCVNARTWSLLKNQISQRHQKLQSSFSRSGNTSDATKEMSFTP